MSGRNKDVRRDASPMRAPPSCLASTAGPRNRITLKAREPDSRANVARPAPQFPAQPTRQTSNQMLEHRRVRQNPVRRVLVLHLAGAEDVDAVRHAAGELGVLLDQQHREMRLAELAQRLADLAD